MQLESGFYLASVKAGGLGVEACGRCNIGALIIKIGFGAHPTILITRNPHNSKR